MGRSSAGFLCWWDTPALGPGGGPLLLGCAPVHQAPPGPPHQACPLASCPRASLLPQLHSRPPSTAHPEGPAVVSKPAYLTHSWLPGPWGLCGFPVNENLRPAPRKFLRRVHVPAAACTLDEGEDSKQDRAEGEAEPTPPGAETGALQLDWPFDGQGGCDLVGRLPVAWQQGPER